MTTPTKSYRLSTEALDKLERLATYYQRSQAQQLTWLINRAYEEMVVQDTNHENIALCELKKWVWVEDKWKEVFMTFDNGSQVVGVLSRDGQIYRIPKHFLRNGTKPTEPAQE